MKRKSGIVVFIFGLIVFCGCISLKIKNDVGLKRAIVPGSSIGLYFYTAPKMGLGGQVNTYADYWQAVVRVFLSEGYRVNAYGMIPMYFINEHQKLSEALKNAIGGAKSKAEVNDLVRAYMESTKDKTELIFGNEILKKEYLTKVKRDLGVDYFIVIEINEMSKIYNAMAVDLGSYEIVYSQRYEAHSDMQKPEKSEVKFCIKQLINGMQGRPVN